MVDSVRSSHGCTSSTVILPRPCTRPSSSSTVPTKSASGRCAASLQLSASLSSDGRHPRVSIQFRWHASKQGWRWHRTCADSSSRNHCTEAASSPQLSSGVGSSRGAIVSELPSCNWCGDLRRFSCCSQRHALHRIPSEHPHHPRLTVTPIKTSHASTTPVRPSTEPPNFSRRREDGCTQSASVLTADVAAVSTDVGSARRARLQQLAFRDMTSHLQARYIPQAADEPKVDQPKRRNVAEEKKSPSSSPPHTSFDSVQGSSTASSLLTSNHSLSTTCPAADLALLYQPLPPPRFQPARLHVAQPAPTERAFVDPSFYPPYQPSYYRVQSQRAERSKDRYRG